MNDWSPGELFRIVTHGFKFTGMPAFGLTHPPQKNWNIVAFLKTLPGMSASEYQKLRRQKEGESQGQPPHPGPHGQMGMPEGR